MRFSAFTSALLLGVTVVSALPTELPSESVNESLNILEARSLKVEVLRRSPAKEECPATNNGPGRDYVAHTYTEGQLKAAFLTAATLQADGKQIGDKFYPHKYGNIEELEFECGANKMEFPILLDGQTYTGGDVSAEPDRLVYEYQEQKGKLRVKFCGVIRHGPTKDFLNCSSK